MEVIALQSGSSGNCIYVEAGGKRLLFDAGISGRQAEHRLASHGRDIRDVDALIISHDHSDHAQCMGIYQRKFGIPIYVTAATLDAARRKIKLGSLHDVRHFGAGDTFVLDEVRIETVRTPHDAADGVVFVIDDGLHRIGILTDLGHVFDELDEILSDLDAVFIESNHDLEMLAGSLYPESLKRRIRSSQGHLSNHDAAELIRRAASPKLKWVCLAHLSEESNTPELAIETHQQVLGAEMPVFCASRTSATKPLRL
ncbi:MAG: MBL fold metallo-hydrolase [Rubripirellula sp.]